MGNVVQNVIDLDAIRVEVAKQERHHLERLRVGLKASLVSLGNFQSWIGEEMRSIGMEAKEYQVDPAELAEQPACLKSLRDNPESLNKGPNMVGRIPGQVQGKGMLLFAHADKVPATYEWGRTRSDLVEKDGRLYGPGIADDVSGLTAMLSAVEVFRNLGIQNSGEILIASVLGKQMGVFGTYGLMRRFGPVDTAIYIHPAESGDGLREVKIASLGLLEYNIEIEGKGPDSTDPSQAIFSKTAVSAVAKGVAIYQGLHAWAAEAAKRYHHEGLEKLAGQSFAMTEGFFHSGGSDYVYQIPTRCTIEGTLCFPPDENLEAMKDEFRQVFDLLVAQDPWLADGHAHLEWGDKMGESIQSDEESEFLRMASGVLTEVTGQEPEYYYGHSVSDIRYPLLYWNAQACGVGPLAGDLAKETEWVDRKEYLDTIVAVAEMLRHAA